jgi:hypothetical protein
MTTTRWNNEMVKCTHRRRIEVSPQNKTLRYSSAGINIKYKRSCSGGIRLTAEIVPTGRV